MKVRSLLFLSIAVGALLGFTGCIKDGGNVQSLNGLPSYVGSSSGKTTLDCLIPGYGSIAETTFYTPDLTGTAAMPGDFILSNVYIDYDNQPAGSSTYYTASVTNWLPVPDSDVNFEPGDVVDSSYPDSISDPEFYTVALLKQHVFMFMPETVPAGQDYEYEMKCNTDSTNKYAYPMMYLTAKISKTSTSAKVKDSFFHAFDMRQLLAKKGSPGYEFIVKDTITTDGFAYTYAKFRLFYQSGTDKSTGKPVFKAYGENPVTVYQSTTKS